MKLFYLAVIATLCVSCTHVRNDFDNASISKIGKDSPTSFCQYFSLTPREVEVFLNASKIIDQKTLHDKYDFLPCYVNGEIDITNGEKSRCSFSIRAGGTAELRCENGDNLIYACDTCGDLLRE